VRTPFVGVNLWQAMWWGAHDPLRLERELAVLKGLGVSVVRILAGSEGPDDAPHRVVPSLTPDGGAPRPEMLAGLEHALDAIAGAGLGAIVCLGNFWHWSGGLAQYRAWCDGSTIPYPVGDNPDWDAFSRYAAGFYESTAARALFAAHLEAIVGPFATHEGVFMFEILNEPRGVHVPDAMRAFLHQSAARVRELSEVPISLGSEGSTTKPELAGLSFEADHTHGAVTHTTIHLWPENWGHWDPAADDDDAFEEMLVWARAYVRSHAERARTLGRPLIVEELGLSRDGGGFTRASATTRRDRFFEAILDELRRASNDGLEIAGILFWAWGGEELGARPGAAWVPGDPLSGDPPHEPQGWYGISSKDESTLEILRSAASRT
jgi:mannan endo-1,4-beta-mannosidase